MQRTRWPRQTCNLFLCTFIKHLFKRRNVLHIGCLVEKLKNHIVLIWTITFRDCVSYSFAGLFCLSKREHLKLVPHPFSNFYGNIFKNESGKTSVLIWTNFGSFVITYLIQVDFLKNFIFQERLSLTLWKHKKTWN